MVDTLVSLDLLRYRGIEVALQGGFMDHIITINFFLNSCHLALSKILGWMINCKIKKI
jgi:hypothetical protein